MFCYSTALFLSAVASLFGANEQSPHLVQNPSNQRTEQSPSPSYSAPGQVSTPRDEACNPCDLDCDAILSNSEVFLFAEAMVHGLSACSPCAGDIDSSGTLDGLDIQLFLDCILRTAETQVVILQNGTVVPNPSYPYEMESYNEGDLPELRAFASAAGIFDGINMTADWKDREWEMIKAISAWLVQNARMSAVGANSKHDLSGRGIAFLRSLSTGGQIVAWGADDSYGNVSGVSALSPNQGFLYVAAGMHHSLALRRSGEIEAWGRNQFGQGTEPNHNGGFRLIAAGANHNLAIRDDGHIIAWGDNRFGQCDIPPPNEGFAGVSAGVEFSAGLTLDGRVVTWGTMPADVPLNEEWQGRFIKIAAGGYHCLGLLDDGKVVAWGSNNEGQCDVPTHYGSYALQDRIIDISAGKRRSYAVINIDSGVIAWGSPLDTSLLPNDRFRSVWPSPFNKYLLACKDTVPNEQATIDDPVPVPEESTFLAAAYDSDREVTISFGGVKGNLSAPPNNDTNLWDGISWDDVSPPLKPSARSKHCMAFDSQHKKTIMWGRDTANEDGARDAWEFDGSKWSGPYAVSGTRPSAFWGCRAIWDPDRGAPPSGRVTVFFGRDVSNIYETAFDYDCATHTFEPREISGSPGARYAFGLAHDQVRNKIVIFGGADSMNQVLNDTQEASAGGTGPTTFSRVTPTTTSPAARMDHAMVYDAARNRVVMYGGRRGAVYYDETWEWDGTDWEIKSPMNSPGQRMGHDMVYDATRQVVVMFGGRQVEGATSIPSNETWEWDGINWTQKNLDIIPRGMIPDLSETDFTYVGYATGSQFGLGLIDYVWSCGAMQQMFCGLCVSQGIPSRLINGESLSCGADTIAEVYSTRWNKWILFWPYSGRWVENAQGVPQSHAEMRAHLAAANYSINAGYELQVGRRGWKATSENGSGLVFQPNAVCTAPLHPRAEIDWWSSRLRVNPELSDGAFDYFQRNFTTSLSRYNSPNPVSTSILLDDFRHYDAACGTQFSSQPISFDGDPNLTYPINNVQAEVTLEQKSPARVRIRLTNNMVPATGNFEVYQISLNNEQTWTSISLLDSVAFGVYDWYPTESSLLMIRGVNSAGVHSPDVVIQYLAGS